MATRSLIGIVNSDGSIEKISVHFDGFDYNVGRILEEHYNDEVKIRELLALGDLSSLGEEIREKHPYNNPHSHGSPERQNFNQKYDKMCCAYGRDRGDGDSGSKRLMNIAEFMEDTLDYNYLYRDGRWEVSKSKLVGETVDDIKRESGEWRLVEEVLSTDGGQ